MSPKTPLQNFRADQAEWDAWGDRAREQGTTLSDVIRTLLREWMESPQPADRLDRHIHGADD